MKFDVGGMTCSHCVTVISRAVDVLGGQAFVDLPAGQVTVSGLSDLDAARQAIEGKGYIVLAVDSEVAAFASETFAAATGAHSPMPRRKWQKPELRFLGNFGDIAAHLLAEPASRDP